MKTKYQALHLIKLARQLKETELTANEIALMEELKSDSINGEFISCFPFVLNLLPALFDQ